jgi:hypothetical protein
MRLCDSRVLTSLVTLAACAFAIWHGSTILRFASARAAMGSYERPVGAVRPWMTVTGVAGAALAVSLTEPVDAGDRATVRRRADALSAIIAEQPLSAMHWLSLASTRLVTAEPLDKVAAALAMSALTGPNEAFVMSQRGLFGLLQWEVLPADQRRRAMADFAGAIPALPNADHAMNAAKAILSAKTDDVREEVAVSLRAQGLSPSDLARVGL